MMSVPVCHLIISNLCRLFNPYFKFRLKEWKGSPQNVDPPFSVPTDSTPF